MSTTESPGPLQLGPLQSELSRLGLEPGPEAEPRFARYLALIEEWRVRAGITAIRDAPTIQRRLFGESLALLVALREGGVIEQGAARTVVDIGSGAGIPGVPMLIAEPALALTLIESHGRRCEFLETAAAELGLEGVAVRRMRAEEAGRDPELREGFELAVARAVAPLPVLVEYALPLLRPGGILAAPKGSRARDELRDAEAAIEALGGHVLEPLPLSLPEGVAPQLVVLVQRDRPLPERYPRRPGIPSKRPLA